MATQRRSILLIAAIVSVCAVLGGVYGSRLGSAALASRMDAVEAQAQELERIAQIVRHTYADPVDLDKTIYNGAIPAMLRGLDPHSIFFDPDSFRRLQEEQRGSYAGVGMIIRPYYGETIVDYPFPSTPAFRAGIRPGDVITKVDGAPTDDFSVEEVARRVRGPEGTTVRLSLRRNGVADPIEVDLVRRDISRPSVPLAFFVKPGIGYIKINNFIQTTGEELDEEFSQLEDEGLKELVLDLRNNQGGLLTGGVYVADKFLKREQKIVSHHGRASEERVYRARHGQDEPVYPMVVLVNCGSASAAEIVAGALQDHDRALIVGSNTFGKGLVQSVFNLSNGTGLVLTTARYYTPSGRLIQRPYDHISQRDYYTDPCSANYEPVNSDPRLTDGGRRVYGGAGITPDVKLPELTLNAFQQRLEERRAFEGYAQEYCLAQEELPSGWEPTARIIEEFRGYLETQLIPFDPEEFEKHSHYVRRMLKKHVYTACVDADEGMRVDIELDPAVRQAIKLLPEARALLKNHSETFARQN